MGQRSVFEWNHDYALQTAEYNPNGIGTERLFDTHGRLAVAEPVRRPEI